MKEENPDVRWRQRFDNFNRAFSTLANAVELAQQRDLSELEQQGIIQGFEFTHELAWNVLKDYLEEEGGTPGLIGSKDTTRLAFKRGLIEEGEVWMEMIKARNLTSHTYNPEIAQTIASNILKSFFPAFSALRKKFSER